MLPLSFSSRAEPKYGTNVSKYSYQARTRKYFWLCTVRSISEGNYCCARAKMELITAARNGDIATVRRLLREGHVGVNVTDKVGVSFEHDPTAIEHRRDSDVVEKMQPRESAPRRSDQG